MNQYATLMDLVDSPVRYHGHDLERLEQYLGRWREMEKIPAELMPPEIPLSRESFVFIQGSSRAVPEGD